MPSAARRSTASAPSPLRPLLRRPGVIALGFAVAGLGLGFKHMATTMRENEAAQKNAGGRYVSVDRSGGGI